MNQRIFLTSVLSSSFGSVLLLTACTSILTPQVNGFPPAPYVPISAPSSTLALSEAQLNRVGKKIWQNECGGTVSGLTSWNNGENFASLGIGHFIWYPSGANGPFTESFPPLLSFLQSKNVGLPNWLKPGLPCPWSSRRAFQDDQNSTQMQNLRHWLASTVELQTAFILDRLDRALPEMLNQTPPELRSKVAKNFRALADTASGSYALIDYVNFKGEGTNLSERYQGQGWGLLQVLQEMNAPTPAAFSDSAKRILTRRVELSPKNERQWLNGWLNRCDTYKNF